MTLDLLKKQLEQNTQKRIKLNINDNRTTMLSVRWHPNETKISLHRLFLDAPQNIMEALACYVAEEKGPIPKQVRAFIDSRFQQFDYSHELDLSTLRHQGHVYNLRKVYDNLNREYFDNLLNLHITWFGKGQPRAKNRLTFGLYHDQLKLIKINRLLDSPSFPDYLLGYVVYHEMVHHVCPSYYDEKGIHRVHSKEFKEKEKEFKHFNLAQEWIRSHKEFLFYND